MTRSRFLVSYILATAALAAGIFPSLGTAAGYDLPRLEQAASTHGWTTAWADDGSLLLSRASMPAVEQESASVAAQTQTSAPVADPLAALGQRLADAGWQVSRDHDGSLLFWPRGTHTQATTPVLAAQQESPVPAIAAPVQPDRWADLGDRLARAGWQVSRDDDGSLLLFPRGAQQHFQGPCHATPNRALQRLALVLRQRGWNTAFDARGDLLLFVG